MFLNLRFFSINIQFQWYQINNLNVKFLPFKIFPNLVFKSTAPQKHLKWAFRSYLLMKMYTYKFMIRTDIDYGGGQESSAIIVTITWNLCICSI
jgi:hypothetical protein